MTLVRLNVIGHSWGGTFNYPVSTRWLIDCALAHIQEDRKEQEKLPEMTDTLEPPPEVAVATLMLEEMEWEYIMEEEDARGLMEQEQKLQKGKEDYAIYIARISKEEESDTETDSDKSPYFF